MTVADLIAALQDMPQDAPVLLRNNEFQNYYALEHVRVSTVKHTGKGLGDPDDQWEPAFGGEVAVLLADYDPTADGCTYDGERP